MPRYVRGEARDGLAPSLASVFGGCVTLGAGHRPAPWPHCLLVSYMGWRWLRSEEVLTSEALSGSHVPES